jgi:hypothetical protein
MIAADSRQASAAQLRRAKRRPYRELERTKTIGPMDHYGPPSRWLW